MSESVQERLLEAAREYRQAEIDLNTKEMYIEHLQEEIYRYKEERYKKMMNLSRKKDRLHSLAMEQMEEV